VGRAGGCHGRKEETRGFSSIDTQHGEKIRPETIPFVPPLLNHVRVWLRERVLSRPFFLWRDPVDQGGKCVRHAKARLREETAQAGLGSLSKSEREKEVFTMKTGGIGE